MSEVKSWNSDMLSWKERNEFLFKNEIMSDCKFLVVEADKTTVIPAHKYVLAASSPEFFNLFYLMKCSDDEIPIKDTSVENLTKFLQFLYTEKTTVTMQSVAELLKLAKRYSVKSFEKTCWSFVTESVKTVTITQETALNVLDQYSAYDVPNLANNCVKLIRNYKNIFESAAFLKLKIRTIAEILKSEELKGFKETTIYNGLNKWAENFCKESGKSITSENKRMAVKPALKFVRFPSMTLNEFTSCTTNNPILAADSIVQIFQCIGGETKSNCEFSAEKRLIERNILEFKTGPTNSCISTSLSLQIHNTVTISVDKSIHLINLGINGVVNAYGASPGVVTFKLKDTSNTPF